MRVCRIEENVFIFCLGVLRGGWCVQMSERCVFLKTCVYTYIYEH